MNQKSVMSEFQIYLKRSPELAPLTFKEFYKSYDYKETRPKESNVWYQEVHYINNERTRDKIYYIYSLSKPRAVVRLNPIPWDCGEMWWLRMIIRHIPVLNSVNDAKNVNGTIYQTFQDAAAALGLLENTNEAEICFNEAVGMETPPQLRSLFVALTIQGFRTLRLYEIHKGIMSSDLSNNINELLSSLDKLFRLENKCMVDYGLPAPNQTTSMLQKYLSEINIQESEHALTNLHELEPNTAEMDIAYNDVKNSIDNANPNDDCKFIVIDSMGGSGKSTFAKKIYHYARSKNKVVLGGAATGLATSVYGSLNFETFHTLFSIPVIEDEEEFDSMGNIYCNTETDPDRTDLINNASVFILDEAFSAHKYCFTSIMSSYNHLKGKVALLLMDRGQTAPVVKYGNRRATVDATILTLPIWESMTKYEFKTNLRLAADLAAAPDDPDVLEQQQFSKDLKDLRTNGINNQFLPPSSFNLMASEPDTGKNYLRFKGFRAFTIKEEAIFWMYPNGLENADHANIAILSTLNKDVEEWNNSIQELNVNPLNILYSANQLADVDDERGVLSGMLNFNTLQFWEKTGVPKHELRLKVGDVCFLMRSLYKNDKLAKNTRVKIISIAQFRITVSKLSDPSKIYTIPRIRFKISHFLGTYTIYHISFLISQPIS